MAKSGAAGQWRWLWLTFFTVVGDLASKAAAVFYLNPFKAMKITPFLNLVIVHNRGSAFGFLADQTGWQLWLFIAIALGVSIGILTYLWRSDGVHPLTAASLSLILGGALGNLYDRVLHGYVLDFIDFYFKDYHWPAFNVADIAISLGVFLFILSGFRKA